MALGGQHVGETVLFQPHPQVRDLPVGLVRGDPGERHLRGQRTLEHGHREPRLGGELHLVRHTGGAAAVPVDGPGLRQVELAVDQRVPASTGVDQEHPDPAVLHPPRGPGVLPLHPGRAGALLQEPGVVEDQHTGPVAELLDDVAAHVVADPVDVPVRGAQQPLHPVRRHRPGVLGQRPPVPALQPGEQAVDIRPDPPPGLGPPEPPSHPLHQRVQHTDPPTKIHHTAILAAEPTQPPTTRPSAVAVLDHPAGCCAEGLSPTMSTSRSRWRGAARRISRSNSAIHCRSSVGVPGRVPASTSAWRLRVDPQLLATRASAPLRCPVSSRISNTIRTARSRSSSGYFFGADTAPPFRGFSASTRPGAVHLVFLLQTAWSAGAAPGSPPPGPGRHLSQPGRWSQRWSRRRCRPRGRRSSTSVTGRTPRSRSSAPPAQSTGRPGARPRSRPGGTPSGTAWARCRSFQRGPGPHRSGVNRTVGSPVVEEG